MLYAFFKYSKPIHYLLSSIFTGMAVIGIGISKQLDWLDITGALFFSIASLLLFQFILIKNELVGRTAYGIWVFTILLIAAMLADLHASYMIALFILLFSWRKLLTMRTVRGVIPKIFDAAFWLGIICFLDPWYALLIFIIYTAIFLYAPGNFRHWLIPLIAFICIGFLTFTVSYVFNISISKPWENNWIITSIDIAQQGKQAFIFYSILLLSLSFLVGYIIKMLDFNKRVSPAVSITMMTLLVICMILVINRDNPQGTIVLSTPFIAIYIGRIVNKAKNKVLAESLLWIPVVILLIQALVML